MFLEFPFLHFYMLSAWAAIFASSSSLSYFPASKVQPNICLKNTIIYVLIMNIFHQNMTTYENIKIYSKHSHFSHVFGRFIKPGKVCYWQGPEIPVFYGKFNLLLYSLVWKSELSKEKFNLVLFPDDKMRSEPVTSSHCGHPEMGGWAGIN